MIFGPDITAWTEVRIEILVIHNGVVTGLAFEFLNEARELLPVDRDDAPALVFLNPNWHFLFHYLGRPQLAVGSSHLCTQPRIQYSSDTKMRHQQQNGRSQRRRSR